MGPWLVIRLGNVPGSLPPVTQTNWDTSDPVFHEHWRKLAEQIRPHKAEQSDRIVAPVAQSPLIKAAVTTLRKAPAPVLDEVLAARTIDELRIATNELNRAQQRVIERLIAQFEREQEEQEIEILLLSVV